MLEHVDDYNILAFDPGAKTGWALFSYKGDLVGSGEIPVDQVESWLDAVQPRVVVMETYKNMPWKKQGGSDMPASQVEGIIRNFCQKRHVQLVEQKNTVKPIAYKWAGLKKKSHANDAIAHGWYYCQRTGIKKSRLIE